MTVFTCNWTCCDNTKYKDYKCHGKFCHSFVEGQSKTLNSLVWQRCVLLRVHQGHLILMISISCLLWKSDTKKPVTLKSYRKRELTTDRSITANQSRVCSSAISVEFILWMISQATINKQSLYDMMMMMIWYGFFIFIYKKHQCLHYLT